MRSSGDHHECTNLKTWQVNKLASILLVNNSLK